MHGPILLVEDDLDAAELLREGLRKRGIDVILQASAEACLAWLQTGEADVVVTDIAMPGMSGIELCAQLKARHPNVIAIVLTGMASLETAIAAIRAGAYDYVTKPVKVDVLEVVISRAASHAAIRRDLRRLRAESIRSGEDSQIVGSSAAIVGLNQLITRIAASDATVLIHGESGTGKELVARALHDLSDRRDAPFVAVNCAAIPAELIESELFGHLQGAFTHASRDRLGLFTQAGTGTILLDEIGELPLAMQVKLLRVLQERRVRPVGGDGDIAMRARVLAATNRSLEHEVAEGRFREDLFYRVNVLQVAVPPLRERGADVLVLAHYFLRKIAERVRKQVESISASAACKLLEYDWPGNVRELESCMERAVALCRLSEITIEDLPRTVIDHGSTQHIVAPSSPLELVTIDEMVGRYVRHVLAQTDGNKTHAARLLGIDRRSLYRRLELPFEQRPAASESEAADV